MNTRYKLNFPPNWDAPLLPAPEASKPAKKAGKK